MTEALRQHLNADSGPPGEAPAVSEMLIVFWAGPLRLGLDLRRVSEIARTVPLSTPVSGGSGVAGMITLRGIATAVVDLPTLLGVGDAATAEHARLIAVRSPETIVCLRVDRVEGIRELSEVELQAPPPLLADVAAPWLDFVLRSPDGELVGVMNLDSVLARASFAGAKGCSGDD